MKKVIVFFLSTMVLSAVLSTQTRADACLADGCLEPCREAGVYKLDACKPCDRTEDNLFCGPCDSVAGCGKKGLFDQFQYYGWIQAGIRVNNHGSKNQYTAAPNGPCSRGMDAFSGNSYLLMTEQPADFHVNQIWLGMSKRLDTRRGFDWGFQGDVFFGTDAKFGQSFGDHSFDYDWGTGDYNTSIPQLYVELGYKKWSLKVGKFAGTMVHEVLPAPMSFFYSHAYICFATPLTMTGAVATYEVTKNFSVSAGWTTGMHDSFRNRFDDNAFLGNATWRPTKSTSIAYNIYYSDVNGLSKRADAADYGKFYYDGNEFIQTVVFDWMINCRWSYGIEGVYVDNKYDRNPGSYKTKTYGINQYLIYTINSRWGVGLRGEWQRTEGGIFDMYSQQGGDLYEVTLGANWNPTKCFTLRPEIRYDWADFDQGFKPFNAGANGVGRDKDQLSVGCSAIVKF